MIVASSNPVGCVSRDEKGSPVPTSTAEPPHDARVETRLKIKILEFLCVGSPPSQKSNRAPARAPSGVTASVGCSVCKKLVLFRFSISALCLLAKATPPMRSQAYAGAYNITPRAIHVPALCCSALGLPAFKPTPSPIRPAPAAPRRKDPNACTGRPEYIRESPGIGSSPRANATPTDLGFGIDSSA